MDKNHIDGNTAINQDELILQQQRQIEKEISETTPLVSELQTISTLDAEYNDDPVYSSKVKDLASKYEALRHTRPDGNCFFRAFAYSYLEYLINNREDYEQFKEKVASSKERLISLGLPQFTLEDFYETFMEVIQRVAPPENADEDNSGALSELHRLFNEQGFSDYVVVYLRLITSGQIEENADFYADFIGGYASVKEFRHQVVEPMYKESDHIHIIAICTALGVGVRVEYMDRGDGGQVKAHDFPEDKTPRVYLLYRPGHYDILYAKVSTPTDDIPDS
uniref:Ubiquitin thioesterase n=1 Tax=Lutzomyia longipalpis TaxID=7200 RepID=A0A1B0GKB7_LUTLO